MPVMRMAAPVRSRVIVTVRSCRERRHRRARRDGASRHHSLSGHRKRGCGAAVANTLGSTAGLVASNVFLAREQPYYPTGYAVALASIWVALLAATALFVGMHYENRRRDRRGRHARPSCPPEQLASMGDDHPDFRFML